jgi:uncharacterized protein YhjY with autotransporter beta-barrel domain
VYQYIILEKNLKPINYLKQIIPSLFIVGIFVSPIQAEVTVNAADKAFWQSVCGNTTNDPIRVALGNNLQTTCQQILNTPGSAAHSTGAVIGNNFIVSGSLSRTTQITAEERKSQLKKRLQELKEQQEKGSGAGDILDSERFGFFLTGKTTQADREQTIRETGFYSNTNGFVIGGDYQFPSNLVAGLAVGYSNTSTDYNANNGKQDVDAISVMFYGQYAISDQFSMNSYAGWNRYEYTLVRNISIDSTVIDPATPLVINATATGNTSADQFVSGLTLNYDFAIDAWNIIPQLSFDYTQTWIAGYTENEPDKGLALRYQDQTIYSYKSMAGFNISHANSFSWGVLLPHAKLFYVHEYHNNSRTIYASFTEDPKAISVNSITDSPDRDYLVFGIGISAILPHSTQIFIDFEKTEAHRYINSYSVSTGLRIGF